MRPNTGLDLEPATQGHVRGRILVALLDQLPYSQRIDVAALFLERLELLFEFLDIFRQSDRGLCFIIVEVEIETVLGERCMTHCAGNDIQVRARVRQPLAV